MFQAVRGGCKIFSFSKMLYSFQAGILPGKNILSPEESHHLVVVRRARIGEAVTLLDGAGRSASGVLDKADSKAAVVEVGEIRAAKRSGAPLVLAQAMPLGRTMDAIVQKAAELGAAEVIPLLTARSELRLDAERTQRKVAKWRAEAVEAVKQCGNPFLPEIRLPVDTRGLASSPLPQVRLVCSLEGSPVSLTEALSGVDAHGGAVIAIGPEGDFTPGEYALLRESGFVPVTLGPLVLRSDTAAIAALAVAGEILRHNAALPPQPL